MGANPRGGRRPGCLAAQRRHFGALGDGLAGTYTKLFYHIVFSTKQRQNFISAAIEEELHKYLAGVVRGMGDSCVAVNGMPDQVHLLVILPPKVALSDALHEIKANSSKWIHEMKQVEFEERYIWD